MLTEMQPILLSVLFSRHSWYAWSAHFKLQVYKLHFYTLNLCKSSFNEIAHWCTLHSCNCTLHKQLQLPNQCDIWCVCWFRKGLLPSPPPTHQIMWLQFMNQRLLPPEPLSRLQLLEQIICILRFCRAVNGQTIGPRTTRGLRPLETDIAAILPISRGSIRGIWP